MIWKYIRGLLATAGGLMVFIGASTSDFYVMELGTKEPPYIWALICVGIVFLILSIAFSVYTEIKEGEDVHE